jgi:long-chain acyl-CoA synthetase
MNSVYDLYKNGEQVSPHLPLGSIPEFLLRLADKKPEFAAIQFYDVDHGETNIITYKRLNTLVRALAYTLQNEYHLVARDSVALHLSNSPWLLIFHLACWSIGCITVPLDLKRDDYTRKSYKISETDAKLIVAVDLQEVISFSSEFPSLRCIGLDQLKLDEIEVSDSATFVQTADLVALTLFTSGTTALPKGVQLSVRSLFLNADGIREWLEIGALDRFGIVLPLHHINSTTMCLATLLSEGTVVLCSRYSKSRFWEIMARFECTLSSIVPTICYDLLSEQYSFDLYKEQLSHLSRIQLGSAPVMASDVVSFHALYRIPLVQGYGSTETALRVSGVSPWGFDEPLYETLVQENAIGHELKWTNFTVLLADGSEAKERELGELCVRGPILFNEYLHNVSATEEALRDGWFHSGDQGYWREIENVRYFYITGRIKELIIKGGVNISPLALEDALISSFDEVKACFAVGYPDHRFGQEVAVAVVFDETLPLDRRTALCEEIRHRALTGHITGISSYEAPRKVFDIPFSRLPMTSTGKVQRITIQKYVSEMLSPIAETSEMVFRKITPFDFQYFDLFVAMYFVRWGAALSISRETLEEAVKRGVVIGAFTRERSIPKGILFAEAISRQDLVEMPEWMRIYDSVTDSLRLSRHSETGDALLLVGIATEGAGFERYDSIDEARYAQLKSLGESHIEEYLERKRDPVIGFHHRAKGGLSSGAEVMRVLKDARPKDRAALGFSVIMRYPIITHPRISEDASVGVQLIEAAFIYAVNSGIREVFAYSRPAGFLRWVKENRF